MFQNKKWLCVLLAGVILCMAASCKKTEEAGGSSQVDSQLSSVSDLGSDDLDTVGSEESAVESAEESGTTAATSSKQSTTSSKSTSSKAGVAALPDLKGDHIDKADAVLPNFTFSNKTVKVLCHGGEFQNLDNFYSKYGLKIEYDKVVNTEKTAKLQKLIAANNSPDLFCCIFYPSLVTRNYVQNLDQYLNFNSGTWSGIKGMIDNFTWNNKHYYVDTRYYVDGVVWYNKDIFDEYGLDDPWTLYKKGKWDWTAYTSIAKKLTVDANKDGTPEQWGAIQGAMELVNNTTGKGFITYMKNSLPSNNLMSAEIARAINFNMNLRNNGYLSFSQDDFINGKVGMYWGYVWQREPFASLIASGSLGLAPSPKDPNAKAHYMYTGSEGYYIPRGAKNPNGAAALITALRINSFNETLNKAQKETLIKKGYWTEEFQTVYDEMQKCENLVLDPWATFGLGDYFGDFYTRAATESWSKIAEEISPKVDTTIKKIYSTNQS